MRSTLTPNIPSARDHEFSRLIAGCNVLGLRVVDGMFGQPVLIAHSANIPQGTTGDT